MLGSIKKVLVAVGAVAACAVAAPGASAFEWKTIGGPQYNGPAHIEGTLTTTLISNGATMTCDATGGMDLTNTGGSPDFANGFVTSLSLTNCTTSVPNCTVTATADFWPWNWEIETLGFSVSISDVDITFVFAGGACALNGVSLPATGTLTPTQVAWYFDFFSTGSLFTPFGIAVVDGQLDVYAATWAGNPDYTKPIELS